MQAHAGREVGRWIGVILLMLAAGVGGYMLRGSSPNSSSPSNSRSGAAGPGVTGGFPGRQGMVRSATVPVQTDTSRAGTLVAQRQAMASVQPVVQSRVSPQISGVVSQILVNVGDVVKAGQPLIQLDDTQLRIAVQNAQLAVQNAQINLTAQTNATRDATLKLEQQLQAAKTALNNAQMAYQAAQRIYQLGGISQSELNNARANLDTAQANLSAAQSALAANRRAGQETLAQLRVAVAQAQSQLQQAQINLANATLRAPFSGQVAAINVAVGETVNSGSQPLTLVSPERQVRFSVPPADAASLSPGQTLSFSTDAQSFQVKVDQHPAPPASANANVSLTARILGNDPSPAGAVGTLTYPVRLAQGTLVPITALQNDGTRSFVFVVEGGKARAQTVTVLAQAGSQAAVRGLAPNLEVIVNPPPGLLDGVSVAKVESPSPSYGQEQSGGSQGRSSGSSFRQSGSSQPPRRPNVENPGQPSSSPGGSQP
ncbi:MULTISPECIES: efflux RND transporter periplasmic adaptor subunit [unclassified Meiothermus]|uniref:efflux RND transporter periplasmic adaptor subunit n=1 Tax=unclassified Meiothermus TaxID=370471 RepID=UPI000D7CAEA2|nr:MULTISPECIES: HlyD family efflux transporter periplasmic adaptor subunit [unclassified Meiothermus]PZA07730.1 efflux RND transporter periplasmic adaptor subunit [Meiothermus sp. Pnk-1]RYM37500.1 HlyD family efflux transporter periplasmic adaptor subunit [Meiothermus sp. PNK-Is4]